MTLRIDFDKVANQQAALVGSPKQIEWAERIRAQALDAVRVHIVEQVRGGEANGTDPATIREYANKMYRLYQVLLRKQHAAWWIDHQSCGNYGSNWLGLLIDGEKGAQHGNQ